MVTSVRLFSPELTLLFPPPLKVYRCVDSTLSGDGGFLSPVAFFPPRESGLRLVA